MKIVDDVTCVLGRPAGTSWHFPDGNEELWDDFIFINGLCPF